MTEKHIEREIDTWVREPGRAEITEGAGETGTGEVGTELNGNCEACARKQQTGGRMCGGQNVQQRGRRKSLTNY